MIHLIANANNSISIHLDSFGKKLALPALWLRERTQDPTQVDLKTQQRLFNPHLLPADLHITNAKLVLDDLSLTFSDTHEETFSVKALSIKALRDFTSHLPDPLAWKSADSIEALFDWNQVLENEGVFFQSLNIFLQYGYIILDNTPTLPNSILHIAEKYGYVRATNFGVYFEVYSRPNANDLAYTSHAIGPHTDNPYRDPVPGIQLLHCLVNETDGGESTLVDSISVAQQLKDEDPEGFRLLSTIPVRFRFKDDDTSLLHFHPLIDVDSQNNIIGIHYSPRLDDLPLLDESQLRQFHSARQRLSELLNDPMYEKRFLLKPGQLMMFDNNRVLHGRTSFNPNQGKRHVQGCYIDRDAPRSHYRKLAEKFEA